MGKAKRFNSYDHKVFQDRKTTENFAKIRQDVAGIGSSFRDSPMGSAFTKSTPNLLEKDTSSQLQGALGFDQGFNTISGGVLKLDVIAGVQNQSKSFMLIVPESGSTDTLDNLTGRAVKGQIVVLAPQSSGSIITITNLANSNDGIFQCPDGVDYTLSYPNSVWLIDESSASPQTWRIIGVASSGGGDNLGNHTATTNLLMSGNDIYFDTPGDDKFQHVGTSIFVWNNAVNTFRFAQTVVECRVKFRPNGNSLDLGDSSNKWRHLYLNSGFNTSKIFFDGGGDTYITGSGASGRINIFSDGVNIAAFTTGGLDMLAGDVDLNNGRTIDWATTQSTVGSAGVASSLPANPTGYVVIKVNGVERVMPFYAKS